MTTLQVGVPVAPHTTRRAVIQVAVGVALFTGAAAGLYEGAHALAAHFNRPDGTTFVNRTQFDHELSAYNHSPASKAGAFVPSVSISGGDVQVGGNVRLVP